jgi:alpha-ribazole phosphatase
MTMSRLWLVRHAPVLAPPGTCYGQLDLAADSHATAQCAEELASVLPHALVLHHSPLQRCELLALAIQALRPDLALNPDPRLREMDFGRWEGIPWANLPRDEIDAWAEQLADVAPGGGEPLAAMLARVAAALGDAHASVQASGTDVVWIAHAGVARCVQWLLGDRARASLAPCAAHWPREAPAPGAWAHYALRDASSPGGAAAVR